MTRLTYHGIPGAFGEAACALADPDAAAVPHPSPAAAIAAVVHGDCEAAVLPVANSVAGTVADVVALLPGSGLETARHITLPIRMALLGVPGATLAMIRIVASHPVALRQCARIIARLGAATEAASSTAAAAAALGRTGTRDRAVLAAPRAAELHGLIVLADDVGDDPGAVTTFAVLKRP